MKEIICYCKNISKKEILKAIEDGAKKKKHIKEMTSAGTGSKCKKKNPKGKSCSKDIKKLLPEMESKKD